MAEHISLGDLYGKTSALDTRRFPDERFDLFSVPSYEHGLPQVVRGGDVGSTKQIVEPGDTLLCRIVPHIRRAWVVPARNGYRQVGSGEWIVLRHHDIHPAYLRHFLLSDQFHSQFMRTVAGVGGSLVRARPSTAARIQVPLPPLPEQRRIAAILDEADALRASAGVQCELVRGSVDAQFKRLNANNAEWRRITLAELAAIQGGLTVNAKRASHPIELPYLRVANVMRGRIDLSEVKTIRVTAAEEARVALQDGDLLVVEGHGNPNEVGRVAQWRSRGHGTAHQNHLIRIRPDLSQLWPSYLEKYLNTTGRRYFREVAKTTSGLNTINITNVKECPVVVPPVEIQREYDTVVRESEQLLVGIAERAGRFDALFASLQHCAFRGEL